MIDFTSMKNVMEILYDSLSFKVGKPGKEKPKNHDLLQQFPFNQSC